jgi:hypothetical protein
MMERPILMSAPMVRAILDEQKTQTRRVAKQAKCPYGEPGDFLYVRERFMIESNRGIDSAKSYLPPFDDGRPTRWVNGLFEEEFWEQAHYMATDPSPIIRGVSGARWKPSIHMPKWASRILLRVNTVTKQQLHEITIDDAMAEGVGHLYGYTGLSPALDARRRFSELWNDINGDRFNCSWDDNPFVWKVEFQRVGWAKIANEVAS